eukprot:3324001-Amphidinium_carterae.1
MVSCTHSNSGSMNLWTPLQRDSLALGFPPWQLYQSCQRKPCHVQCGLEEFQLNATMCDSTHRKSRYTLGGALWP